MSSELELRPIPGFPGYSAREDGAIFTFVQLRSLGRSGTVRAIVESPKQLKGSPRQPDGRIRFSLRDDTSKYRTVLRSVLVLTAFKGERPDGMQCCHNDGNLLNDAISNLRWDTRVANCKDSETHGTRVRGSSHKKAKLTEVDVIAIRETTERSSRVARQYGVSESAVSLIRSGKTWKHITAGAR